MLKYHCHFLCSINPISIYTLMIPSCMDRLHRCAYQRKYKHHGLKKLQEIYSLLTIYSKVKIHLYLNNMIYWHQKNNQIKIKIKINNSHQWIQFNFKNFDNLLQHAFFFFFTIFYLFFFIFLYQQEFNLIEIYRIYIYIYIIKNIITASLKNYAAYFLRDSFVQLNRLSSLLYPFFSIARKLIFILWSIWKKIYILLDFHSLSSFILSSNCRYSMFLFTIFQQFWVLLIF